MSESTVIGIILFCWLVSCVCTWMLGWRRGYNAAEKDRALIDNIVKARKKPCQKE